MIAGQLQFFHRVYRKEEWSSLTNTNEEKLRNTNLETKPRYTISINYTRTGIELNEEITSIN